MKALPHKPLQNHMKGHSPTLNWPANLKNYRLLAFP
uniref:Uncharacterized protein n=1 Tax=Arundo donax TaxID=35708 RepID=A0A0A9DZJ4_ARUDO